MDNLTEAFDSVRQKLKDLFDRVNQLEAAPTVNPGGGGGAPVDAQYLVLAFNGTLTQERRLDFSARFSTVDGGANADYDVDLAASGVGAGIYGSATQVPQITVDTYGRITNVANVAITGFVTGSGSAGRVAYWNGISSITGEDALWYDAGNNRLGVNDNTPSYTLDVNGIIGINGIQTVYNASATAGFTGTYYFGNGGGSLSFVGGLDGYYVTAVGNNALLSNTTGYRNTAIGNGSLNALTVGYHNTAIGATTGNAVITNNDCVCIGYNADVSADGTTNETVIGSNVTGNGSNTITIGSGIGMTATYLGGNVIIEEDKYIGRMADVRILFDATGGFINATLGDAAGSDKFRIIDSGSNVVAYIDSNGNVLATEYYTSDGGSFGISGNELLTVNAAGTFSFTGISGITVEDGDYIGNGSATARLVFDSSGATDYAYFSGCKVGIGTTSPVVNLQIEDLTADVEVKAKTSTSHIGTISIDNDTTTDGQSTGWGFQQRNADSLFGAGQRGLSIWSYRGATGGFIAPILLQEDGDVILCGASGVTANGKVGIGTASPAYTLDITGNLRCSTGFSCNGATPQTAYAVNGACTDLATVVALCNQIRAAVIANGICV